MINTYSDYIKLYLHKSGLGDRPCPGEHHFVSAYLIPRLYGINQRVPDYINPDGTKGIVGDVVYYKDNEHHFGIEAKLNVIRLTKGEFNNWIVNTDGQQWPDTFIGIGTSGIGICSWAEFRLAYIAAVGRTDAGWTPRVISRGYGPMKSVNKLFSELSYGKFYRLGASEKETIQLEESFMEALRTEILC